jgi:hypothetical protein
MTLGRVFLPQLRRSRTQDGLRASHDEVGRRTTVREKVEFTTNRIGGDDRASVWTTTSHHAKIKLDQTLIPRETRNELLPSGTSSSALSVRRRRWHIRLTSPMGTGL